MRSFRRFSDHPVGGGAPLRWWGEMATLMLALVTSGCAEAPTSRAGSPRITPASETSRVSSAMAPVTTAPVGERAMSGQKVVFRWRHSYAGPTMPPMLMSIDGVPLGLRPDSSVDYVAARVLLQQIRPTDIVSITVLKGEEALRRFGRAADSGVIMITTASGTWRARGGNP